MNELNKEGIEEYKYVIENKASFPTYNCPFKSDECSYKKLSISERYNNRDICLECKEDFLNKIVE